MTPVIVTSANSPYKALNYGDQLIQFDESNGLQASAVLPYWPHVGQKVAFKWLRGSTGAPPPVIQASANGGPLEPNAPASQASGTTVTSVSLLTLGAMAEYSWDGAIWTLTGST